jgi:hypothetical protein
VAGNWSDSLESCNFGALVEIWPLLERMGVAEIINQQLTFISDRGTFSAGHLLQLSESDIAAIAAVPWDDFRNLFDEAVHPCS